MIPKVLNTAGLISFCEKLNYVNFRQKDEMVLKWEKLLKPQNIIRFFHIQSDSFIYKILIRKLDYFLQRNFNRAAVVKCEGCQKEIAELEYTQAEVYFTHNFE